MESIKNIEKDKEAERYIETIAFIVDMEYSYHRKPELNYIAVNAVDKICTDEGLDRSYCEALKDVARQKVEEAERHDDLVFY
jgi:hypothetical protein